MKDVLMTKTKLVLPTLAIAAVAGSMAFTTPEAHAAKPGMEKCYGVAKAGANDCANASGTHGCAGYAKADNVWDEWKYVKQGECDTMGGHTTAQKPDMMMKK